ncbi:MAG: sulfotransferase [Thiobacillaceae bacterium]
MAHLLQYFTAAVKGTARARLGHRQALLRNPNILAGVEQFQKICPAKDDNDHEEPIFLLSAGWRSGSTLLQRLIMSDSRVLIWGEPYDECGLIQALAESMRAFRPGWPPQEYFYDGTPPSQLSGEWVANLFPSLEDWRRGQRALLETMFAEPAKRAGAKRWGIKEVRLGTEHAFFLRWLYPKARFIFLFRNPLDAYRSYSRYGRNWYDTFPDKPMFTPTAFGKHWRRLADGFLRDAGLLNALVIRYEDLVGGQVRLDEIEQHLSISMDRSLLETKVGSSERLGEKAWVSRLERWLLKRAVAPVANEAGYTW